MTKTNRPVKQPKPRASLKLGARAKREFQLFTCFSLAHNLRRFRRHVGRVAQQPAHIRWERRLPKLHARAKHRRHAGAAREA